MTDLQLPAAPAARPRARRRRPVPWDLVAALAIFLVLAVVDLVLQPALADLGQIGLLLQTGLPLVLVAAAQTMVVLVRGLDLSVGGILAVATVVTASAQGGGPGWIALALAVGIGLGLLNGLLVGPVGMQPFIVTLATWTIFDGIALKIMSTDGGTPPPAAVALATGETAGIPNSVLVVVGLLVAWLLLRRSRFGHRMVAVGTDAERARLNGTPVRAVVVAAFVLSGLLAAFAGVLSSGLTASGSPTIGDRYILTSVAAVVIGGTSLLGGRGGIGLTVLAALSLTLINDIVAAMNADVWVTTAASSGLLLVLVLTRGLVARLSGRRVT
ncbi:ABC transporter permease [Pseudonocardia kujensis]|uniref:ABC transporter permease n=1 Tax=Pseudonocardia kujensis TaxID=1128675 RepID=UPI001E38DE1B|nr:ABC transporter permease [Pseudonocardia kujensis]MCE0764758.1 ABC transporter permease [Pseudonocardia kujensis]